MKRNIRKGLSIFLVLASAIFLCTACGTKEPPKEENAAPESNKTEDYSGVYTDKQGTPDIYSELELRQNGDGTYAVTLGIYRLAEVTGTADSALHFVGDANTGLNVEGDITIDGDSAEITITQSDFPFPEIAAGTTLTFPDGKEA